MGKSANVRVVKKSLYILTPLVFFLLLILYTINYFHNQYVAHDIISNESALLELQKNIIKSEFQKNITDLRVFGNNVLVRRVFESNSADFFDLNNQRSINDIVDILSSFVSERKGLDQVRLLNLKGQEVVIVNCQNGHAVSVSRDKLQTKFNRYYFKRTVCLDKNEVFVSPFDLNIEHGRIELPKKSVIRFGMPVFDSNNTKKGVFLFNYLGDDLIENLHYVSKRFAGKFSLLNADSFWLVSADSSKEFGFMFPDKLKEKSFSLKKSNLPLWQELQANSRGFIFKDKTLYVYQDLYTPIVDIENDEVKSGNRRWFLLSTVSEAVLNAKSAFVHHLLLYIGSTLIIVIVFCVFLYVGIKERVNREVKEKELNEKEYFKKVSDKQRYLQNLIDSLPFPFYVIDVKTYKITLANTIVDAEVGKSTCYAITHNSAKPCNGQNHICPLSQVVKTKKVFKTEHLHYDKDGNPNHYLVHGIPLLDTEGNVTEMIEFSVNITERVLLEKSLHAAKQLAENSVKAKSSFLAMMSHEIRTPMNGVIGMTGLLSSTDLTEEQLEYVDIIKMSGESLLTIIDDILDFSKIESGKMDLENMSLDISLCVEEVIDLLATKAHDKGLNLLYLIGSDVPPSILGDVTRLRQILINLINNAIKFTEKGEVVVSVKKVGFDNGVFEILFAVKDSGIGIPQEKMDRLFKAFSQVDSSTTREYGGTGLGLVISKRLVELMGGKIWVESKCGEGATFMFTVKTAAVEHVVRNCNQENLKEFVGKRVLIFSHDSVSASILTMWLEDWGLETEMVESYKDVGSRVQLLPKIDAVLVDIDFYKLNNDSLHLLKDGCKLVPLIFLGKADVLCDKLNTVGETVVRKPLKKTSLYNALMSKVSNVVSKSKESASKSQDILWAIKYPLQILIAEDNKVNQKIVTLLFKKMGYEIDIVENGEEAINAQNSTGYDLIFMDIQMPVMNGYDATRIILQQQDSPPIVVAMTANVMKEDVKASRDAGMLYHISKPLKVEQVQDVLKRCYDMVCCSR